jgi:hypothetical protein
MPLCVVIIICFRKSFKDHAVIKKLAGSCQVAIRQSSGIIQMVARQSAGSQSSKTLNVQSLKLKALKLD